MPSITMHHHHAYTMHAHRKTQVFTMPQLYIQSSSMASSGGRQRPPPCCIQPEATLCYAPIICIRPRIPPHTLLCVTASLKPGDLTFLPPLHLEKTLTCSLKKRRPRGLQPKARISCMHNPFKKFFLFSLPLSLAFFHYGERFSPLLLCTNLHVQLPMWAPHVSQALSVYAM